LLRRKLSLISLSLLCVVAIYINTFYIFSPFSLTWKDTKRPIQIEYLTFDSPTGWTVNSISKDSKEIRYFIKTFEQIAFITENISDINPQNVTSRSLNNKENLVILRKSDNITNTTKSKGTILFQFRFCENDDYGTTNNLSYFRIPMELKEHILLQNMKLK
jgi:hypothetical protein